MSLEVSGIITWLRTFFDDIYAPKGTTGLSLSDVYPVGAIYMSTTSTSPATLFGFGTWVQIEDKFLLASGTTYTSGNTGGEASHTLTIDEMPSHNHSIENQFSAGDGGSVSRYAKSTNKKSGFSPSTTNTGGSQAHNNMPPYLVVNVWKRTA